MLFRKEAIAHKREQLVTRGKEEMQAIGNALYASIAAIAIGMLVFIMTASLPRKQSAYGVLEPRQGVATVVAQSTGYIAMAHVKDGQFVEKGQPLFTVSGELGMGGHEVVSRITESLALQRDAYEREVLLKLEEARQQTQVLSAKKESVLAQQAALETVIAIADRRTYLSNSELSRMRNLAESGLVTLTQVNQRELEHLDSRTNLETLKRQINLLTHELSAIDSEAKKNSVQLKMQIESLRRSTAQLSIATVEIGARAAQVLSATASGRISFLKHRPTDSVRQNELIAIIVPDAIKGSTEGEGFQAVMYVSSRVVGSIKLGGNVVIRYPAFPYQRFGSSYGVVESIGIAGVDIGSIPLMFQRKVVQVAADSDTFFKVIVKPKRGTLDDSAILSVGMAFDAEIRHESRKVWQWLLDPLLRGTSKFKD
jgi:membrane fusion protein